MTHKNDKNRNSILLLILWLTNVCIFVGHEHEPLPALYVKYAVQLCTMSISYTCFF